MPEGTSTPTATMLTAAEVAPMLGISARKVYELAGVHQVLRKRLGGDHEAAPSTRNPRK